MIATTNEAPEKLDDFSSDSSKDEPTTARASDSAFVANLQAENLALKQMMRLRDAREELTTALAEKGARSPGLLFAYAVDDLQFDEEEKLANVSALVRKLERAFPEQFEERVAVPSINGGAGKPNQPAALTPESLEKMRPSEIARLNWNEVKRVLVNQ